MMKFRENLMRFFDKTFWKFIVVGIINTVFGTVIMFGFYNIFHCTYWISSAANYLFGSILSFFLNKYFTFHNKEKSIADIIRFAINIMVCYLLAYGVAKSVIELALVSFPKDMQENIAMLVGMCIFVILNYCGQRFFVFKKA